jgi:hypothetical protein
MRKLLPTLIGIILVASSCTKDPVVAPTQDRPVAKKIEFDVFASKDYNDPFYDNALAEVRLTISKSSLKNNTSTIVWDTTYNFRQFKQYPQMMQKIQIEKNVEHYENTELLRVSTVVRYNFNGYLSMEAKGEDVLRNQNFKLATVSF